MAFRPQLRPLRHAATVLLIGTIASSATVALVVSRSSAASTSVTAMRAEALQIAGEVDTMQTKIEILSEEYDEASGRATALERQQRNDATAFATAQSKVSTDASLLHGDAVAAYVDAGTSAGGGLSAVFSTTALSLPVQQTYLAAASSNLDTAVATLHNSEITLSAERASIQIAATRAQANAETLASSRAASYRLASELSDKLSGVKGSLEAAVQQAEAIAQAQADAAAAAQAAAAQAAAAASGGPIGGSVTSIGPTAGPSGAASAVIAAAETQIGVPYRWAGTTPGSGFDCSGFTMWAWGKAGINLPHSAEGQYESVEHVSYSELEPGDLAFYSEGGYIYHVSMYIGGGQMIEAEDTGTYIHISGLRGGAVAYGRP